MLLSRRALGAWLGGAWPLAVCVVVGGCGARSRGQDPPIERALEVVPAVFDATGQPLRRCSDDAACSSNPCAPSVCEQGFCVPLGDVRCEPSADPCFVNECDPEDGRCRPVPSTPDVDGDGFHAARLGYALGEPGACGDDCDDRSPDALPGGREVCDGVDNDCDGSIDEGFVFLAPTGEGVLISEDASEAGIGGLVYGGGLFALAYSGRFARNETIVHGMRSATDVVFDASVALTNSDSYAGPLRWTGEQFVTAWEDRRDEDFEIYFNRFDGAGNKLAPDLRLSVAEDFSLNATLVLLGRDFGVLWQDRRDTFQNFQIYGQRVSADGALLGENVNLTPEVVDAQAPSVALGNHELGVAFNAPFEGRQILFRTVAFDFTELGPTVVLSPPNAVGASVSFNAGNYVVLWHEYDIVPGDAIWGAVVAPDGTLLVAPKPVTDGALFARGHDLLPMGDRLLLLWTEVRDDSYDVFLRTLSPELDPLDDPVQVTNVPGDVLGATAAIGPGTMGVAYQDFSVGSSQVYFTELECR